MQAERTFAAMGSSAHVLLVGPDPSWPGEQGTEALLDRAQASIADLERRWSRFRPDSELSRLNASPGVAVMVSHDTFDLIRLAVDAWRLTGGRYDPTVLDALVRAGYDRTFDEVRERSRATLLFDRGATLVLTEDADHSSPGCAGIELDEGLAAVTLPHGATIDLGGVGKGRAADVVALELQAAGALGACVNLGGDARVVGEGPDGQGWVVGIEHPLEPDSDVTAVALADGAVATSARTNRHWSTPDGERHHLIDPATGRPADTGLASVTVVAAEAAWAEILSKAAFVAGSARGAALIAGSSAAGMLVHDDGSVVRTGGFERFEI